MPSLNILSAAKLRQRLQHRVGIPRPSREHGGQHQFGRVGTARAEAGPGKWAFSILGGLSVYLCWLAAPCTGEVLGSESHHPAQHFPKIQALLF